MTAEPSGLSQRQRNVVDAVAGLVPLFVMEMRDWPFEERRDALDVEAIASMADAVQYGSGPKRSKAERDDSARALRAVARGLAVGAYQPGGVSFAGGHWCVEPHCWCPNRPRAVCAVACRTDCPGLAEARAGKEGAERG